MLIQNDALLVGKEFFPQFHILKPGQLQYTLFVRSDSIIPCTDQNRGSKSYFPQRAKEHLQTDA